MTRTAFYAGSFDPVTYGHLDVLQGAFAIAERVVAAVGVHPGKAPLFPVEDRLAMLREVGQSLAEAAGAAFEVVTFDGLAVDAARRAGASVLVRGLRDATDLDYEMQMAGMNGAMAPELTTVFVPAAPSHRPIAATLVRQIAAMGGDVSAFVPEAVLVRLAARGGRR
ncbi:MAG TPA: pantetheine-phosphate adenylyltransferase [Hyphomicrobiales bacterium]|nr:pantetheine-phosphate adenylyltransferase [Hyphomicrobiales bacterium]